jgi:hypothetical protein
MILHLNSYLVETFDDPIICEKLNYNTKLVIY